LENCGRTEYTTDEFDRFFRRVYQHYGSLDGYEKLPDALPFLDWLSNQNRYSLGITTNTPGNIHYMGFLYFFFCSTLRNR
jgi:hypothetical protein